MHGNKRVAICSTIYKIKETNLMNGETNAMKTVIPGNIYSKYFDSLLLIVYMCRPHIEGVQKFVRQKIV